VKIMTDDDHGCYGPSVPDVTLDPPDDRGQAETPECMKYLLSVPAIASELELEVLPYDRGEVAKAIERALATHTSEALSAYVSFLAARLAVETDYGLGIDAQLRRLISALP
jgi:hypothetical protein